MDLQTRKLHFIQKVLSIDNEKIIDKLQALLKKEQLKEGKQQQEEDSKDAILANIKQGLKEMKLVKEGKLKARSLQDLIDEL